MSTYKINIAPFGDALALHMAVIKVAEQSGLDFQNLRADVVLSDLISLGVKLASSREVMAAVWPCLIRCTYDGQKITPDLFEDKEARKLYYPIISECIKVNNADFLDGVPSVFSTWLDLIKPPTSSGTPPLK